MTVLLAATAGLNGCQFFFQCDKASCTTSTTGTAANTGDFAYVSNGTSIAGYNLSSGALTAISGASLSLGYLPVAMKVSPNNAFLYVGGGNGGIYLYSIGSTGALTSASASAQTVLTTGTLSSLDISRDGGFLYVLDGTGLLLNQYQLNTSTGALTGLSTFSPPGTSGCGLAGTVASQSCTVKVSPGGAYVAVALGTAGTVVYPYTSSGGIISTSSAPYTAAINCCTDLGLTGGSGDFSLAFDSNNYLYISRTDYISSYGNFSTGTAKYEGSVSLLPATSGAAAPTPRSVTISSSGSYLYTADEGTGTISGYGLSGMGQLNALSGSPYAGPTNVSALGVDNTGNYLIAVGYNATGGVQLFKPSSGVLGSAVASAGTGTSLAYPALVALTH